ncbi:MAG: FxLYD domain-containing protein [Caldilineaceae bacterium]|nr:FxLYD domain-containing protein [Caldilineaceae bacterium]
MAWFSSREIGLAGLALGYAIALLLLAACGQIVTLPPTPAPQGTPTATIVPFADLKPPETATPALFMPSPTPSLTPTPTPIVYRVEPGDNLGSIATRFGVSVSSLQERNSVQDPRNLQIGQELVIPRLVTSGGVLVERQPTPTPLPFEMQHLHFSHTPLGSLWVMGEVLNTSVETLEQVRVGVQLLDGQGTTLVEGNSLVMLNLVKPGEVAPFAVLFAEAPESFENYHIYPLSALPAFEGGYYQGLEVGNLTQEGERYSALTVRGSIRNTGSAEAIDVQVVLTAYDPLNRVIASRTIVPDHNVVAVGGETTFAAILIPLGGPVERVHVVAQSRKFPAGN